MSCGPFVQFLGYNPSEGLWQGSVLLVTGSGSIGTPDLLVEDFEHCKVIWLGYAVHSSMPSP